MNDQKMIILFDGVCNFCDSTVNFILARDRKDRFRFASLQSDAGLTLQEKFGLNPDSLDTIVLICGEKYYTRSDAALHILRKLGLPWSVLYIFILVPTVLRNVVYDFIARKRYKWFGKRDECRIPSPEERKKFL